MGTSGGLIGNCTLAVGPACPADPHFLQPGRGCRAVAWRRIPQANRTKPGNIRAAELAPACLGHINAGMALTQESLTSAARRKAQRAQRKVKNAEGELETANRTLRRAIPSKDIEAIAQAAVRTAIAEDEVRDAAHELEAVSELLVEGSGSVAHGAASGEGVQSLLPFLGKR
jgi:hypothetical protein